MAGRRTFSCRGDTGAGASQLAVATTARLELHAAATRVLCLAAAAAAAASAVGDKGTTGNRHRAEGSSGGEHGLEARRNGGLARKGKGKRRYGGCLLEMTVCSGLVEEMGKGLAEVYFMKMM